MWSRGKSVICDMAHLSLYQLNSLIKTTLEQQLEPSYWVVAEISEMRQNQKGHCYMEVVKKEGNFVSAKMRANIWAYSYRSISATFQRVTKSPLKPGIKILFNAKINFHEVYGLSLTIQDIDPQFTLGDRARKRQEVIDRLKADGVFDMNQALNLPLVPQSIAIISSETAAGYGDFIDQLRNNTRGFRFRTQLYNALMQGDGAPGSIIKALKAIHSEAEPYDLVVIIRGGGAQADLDCFDDYDLTSHVAQFPLPIITGIGHERDETITDLVAHTKMKTPTAVAEFLVSGLERFEDRLNESIYRIERGAVRQLQFGSLKLQSLSNKLQVTAQGRISGAKEKLSKLSLGLRFSSNEFIRLNQGKIEQLKAPLTRVAHHRVKQLENELELYEKELSLVDPKAVLKRGYSITRLNGRLVGKETPKAGDTLETVTAEHIITSEIKAIE